MPVESKFKVGSRTPPPPRRVIMQVVGGFVPFRVCGLAEVGLTEGISPGCGQSSLHLKEKK